MSTNTIKPKRQKEFFKSSEIAHIWAHRGAPKGRCATREAFDGDTFYSYATPIAKLVTGKGGIHGVIINATSYSSTTSGHQSGVRHAVSHIENKFSITDCKQGYGAIPETGKDLVARYEAGFNEKPADVFSRETLQYEPAKPSKYAHKRAEAFLAKVHNLEEAIRASKFFGIACKKLENALAKLQPEIEVQTKISDDNTRKLNTRRDVRDEANRIKRERREKLDCEQAIIRAKKFIAGESDPAIGHNADYFGYGDHQLDGEPELKAAVAAKRAEIDAKTVDDWIAGDRQAVTKYDWPTVLRRRDDELETSKGARVPLDHAKRAFRIVEACRATKRAYARNGRTEHVGAYVIDSISENGDVVIGCHEIQFSEIERFAKSEGWINSVGYQPKTGQSCHCKPGVHRDNCPDCEGTGQCIDFEAIREK